MNIFSTILEKLGIQKPAASAASPAPAASQPTAAAVARAPSMPTQAPAAHPAAISVVDVVGKLDQLAGENSGLDWKVSIVDLLKLLKMDSSLGARKELATELGCPPELMGGDYSKMNVWLHKTVLQKIADNGGNIPQSLLN
ncbi:MAG TPA: DUF3597 domain-containing protein [Anaerolineales bacterium]